MKRLILDYYMGTKGFFSDAGAIMKPASYMVAPAIRTPFKIFLCCADFIKGFGFNKHDTATYHRSIRDNISIVQLSF